VRRALRSGEIEIKRDLLDGRWSREYECCVECGRTDIRYSSNGRCELCNAKKHVRDRGGVNRVEGKWSMHAEKCVHCGTTEVPHSARGLCEVCHRREREGTFGLNEIECPICNTLVSRLDQHLALKSKTCEKHNVLYNKSTEEIIYLFSTDLTSGDVSIKMNTAKGKVLKIWHENFSNEDITDRGERIRVSKISGENNYLYGTVPHTNITKLLPFEDASGRFFMMRSSWEVKYAQYLDGKSIKWDFEPHKFKYYDEYGYAHYYFPDFYLPEENAYIEIKGYYSDFSKYKVEECTRLYNLNIKVLQKEDLLAIGLDI